MGEETEFAIRKRSHNVNLNNVIDMNLKKISHVNYSKRVGRVKRPTSRAQYCATDKLLHNAGAWTIQVRVTPEFTVIGGTIYMKNPQASSGSQCSSTGITPRLGAPFSVYEYVVCVNVVNIPRTVA